MSRSRALFTACNAAYFPGARATLSSAARHHPDIPRYCMVPEGEAAAARRELGGVAEILIPPRAVAGVPERLQACVYKLFAPEIPADVVAYVDADAIFCAAAPEYWEVSGGMVRGVATGPRVTLESVPRHFKERYAEQFPEVAGRRCFNGGIFSFETAAWRDLPERYGRLVVEGGYSEGYHPIMDQPLLAAIFAGRVDWLPEAFNASNLFDSPIPRDVRLLHFTGGSCKPWDRRYPRHEPQFHLWLRHGIGVSDPLALALSRLRVAFWTPKRLLGRALRRSRGE